MKKLLFFFLIISGIAFAQPPIAQPVDMSVCDNNQTGVETFDLSANNIQILDGLNASLYEIKFYNSLSNAIADSDFITTPSAYTSSSNPETIFVRVHEIANTTNYATTSFNLVVNPLPVFTLNDVSACEGTVVELNSGISGAFLYQWFYGSTAITGATDSNLFVTQAGTYSMTATTSAGCVYSNEAVVTFIPSPVASISGPTFVSSGVGVSLTLTGTPNAVVEYTFSIENATESQLVTLDSSGNLELSLPPFTTNATVCLTSVSLNDCSTILTNCKTVLVGTEGIVNIPDANFKAKLLSALPTNTVAYSNGLAVKIDFNNDNEIQFSEAIAIDSLDVKLSNIIDLEGINSFLNLKKLQCHSNQINSLNISNLVYLQKLRADFNNLASINLINNSQLQELRLNGNDLQTIDVSNLVNLIRLEINNNQLTNILLNTLSELQILDVSGNNLTSINVNENSDLFTLNCSTNPITNLDVTQNLILQSLQIISTPLANIDLSANINLQELNCTFTQLTSLDLSNNGLMMNFYCQNNPLLQYLNIKNGTNGELGIENYNGTTNLQFVCADEEEMEIIQLILGPTVNVNSYCSFTPGGDFNTISGTTRLDTNNNGCDITDITIPFLSFDVSLNAVDTNAQVFSNSIGNYGFFTGQAGQYTLTPNLENPTYFTVSPNPATVSIPLIDNSSTTQNFCITANGVHPDLEIVIVPIMPARPGFDAVYKIVYKNKGNQVETGYVNFTYNDAVLDFVSSSVVPDNNGGGLMNWVVQNIAPFQVGSILVTLNVNSPQEIPAVNIDDVLLFNAFIDVSTDDNWDDNNFDFNQTVVGSYDPNDITCLQGNSLPLNDMGKFLHYNIRFENTGTAPAENIVVKNTIDLTQYNIQSLQIMESSHPMEVKVTGNVAEFIFQSVNLDAGGHGNILLKLKSNATLSEDLVINSADIYFDYNFPIETNEEQTVFGDLSKKDFNKDASIQVYPNPVENIITIKSENTIKTIELYDVQGRLLMKKLANDNALTLDLSRYSSGIYFINIVTAVGRQTQRIIKN